VEAEPEEALVLASVTEEEGSVMVLALEVVLVVELVMVAGLEAVSEVEKVAALVEAAEQEVVPVVARAEEAD
jgi:hypothetical protein